MEVIFLPDAGTDFNYWIDTNNKPILKKIARFIDGIKINPYSWFDKLKVNYQTLPLQSDKHIYTLIWNLLG